MVHPKLPYLGDGLHLLNGTRNSEYFNFVYPTTTHSRHDLDIIVHITIYHNAPNLGYMNISPWGHD